METYGVKLTKPVIEHAICTIRTEQGLREKHETLLTTEVKNV
jgi:hypothetical protein